MAFGDTGILDNFNRSDTGSPPSASWTALAWHTAGLQIISNQATTGTDNSIGGCYWNVGTFGPATEVFVTCASQGSNNDTAYIFTRVQSPGTGGAFDGYCIRHRVQGGTDLIYLSRVDNESHTAIGSTESREITDTNKIGLESDADDLHTFYYDTGSGWTASTVATGTDTTYQSAGYIALSVTDIDYLVDDFGGGTISGVSDLSVEPTDEAVTVGDTATITPLVLPNLSESEAVTVGDTPTLRLNLDLPAQQDDITIGDTATVDPVSPTEISETEPVTVGDTATLDPLLINISETEDITVGETATIDAILLEISESESVTVGDVDTLAPVTPIEISESDAVTVGDTPTVQVPSEDEWYISESDGVTVGDTATLAPVSPIDISETEAITVTDTPTVQIPAADVFYISESESITVEDVATMGPVTPTEISEVEAITVVDIPTVTFFQPILTLSALDAVTVVDTSYVSFPSEFIGKGPPKRKPRREHDPGMWEEEQIPSKWREPQPALATRHAQQAKRNQDERIRLKSEAKERDLQDAAYRNEVAEMMLQQDQERTRQREIQAKRTINLNKATTARDEKQKRQDGINKVRRKSLKKARAAKKRKAKKK